MIDTFRNGEKSEYTGGRTENEIVSWILKRVGPPSNVVDCESLKKTASDNKLVLAYFGDDATSKELVTFMAIAGGSDLGDKFTFVHTFDKDCAASHGASGP